MKKFPFAVAALSVALAAGPALAETDQETSEDTLVRLPGQGEVRREDRPRTPETPQARFVPGGGLILSFDADGDGSVTMAELDAGIAQAFTAADLSADGDLTALEQQDWARSLPTRDETLANPVRFDPNLDRTVNEAEFAYVIHQIAAPYVDEVTGVVPVSALEAPKRPARGEDQTARRPDISARRGERRRPNF